ncbi:glycosyltransferase [[Eubacterium] cellulosolvens]
MNFDKDKNHSISIVIPTLNEEEYLEPTLKAIKHQDYKGTYEIIVSDGGSKDSTVKIANKYADKIVTTKKKGIAIGRNAGAKQAKGDILVFIDADTQLFCNTLSSIIDAFKDELIIGLAIPLFPFGMKTGDVILFLGFNEFIKRTMERGKGKAKIVGACCAYRKSSFDQVNGFNEGLTTLEDFDLSERISKLGKIKYIENTMALVSTRRIAKWGRIKAVERYLSLYLKHLLSKRGLDLRSLIKVDYKPIR